MQEFDPSALERLCELIGGDRDNLHELVETFIDEGAEIVAELVGSLAGHDTDALRRSAHSMKSSAQDFGAGQLATMSAALEARAASGWPATATTDVDALSRSFDDASGQLRAWLARDGRAATTTGPG